MFCKTYLKVFLCLCFALFGKADWFIDHTGQQEMYSVNSAPVVLPNVTSVRTANSTLNLLEELDRLRNQITSLQQIVLAYDTSSTLLATQVASLENTTAELELRLAVVESSASNLSSSVTQLQDNSTALSARIDSASAGCAWEGIACQCYLDALTTSDAALLLGSNCVNGTLLWVKILEAHHFSDIITPCESLVNATTLASCDIML